MQYNYVDKNIYLYIKLFRKIMDCLKQIPFTMKIYLQMQLLSNNINVMSDKINIRTE